MPPARRIAWVERLIWPLIFGGLVTLVLGLAMRGTDDATAWVLIVAGGAAAVAGFLLIWVRSRLDAGSS